jgi:hypothetical protein
MTGPPWGDDSDDLPSRADEPVRRAPFIAIGYWARKGIWRAIWIDNEDGLGKFQGTREEVIAWARARCDDIRIHPGPDDDYQYPRQLGPDDE